MLWTLLSSATAKFVRWLRYVDPKVKAIASRRLYYEIKILQNYDITHIYFKLLLRFTGRFTYLVGVLWDLSFITLSENVIGPNFPLYRRGTGLRPKSWLNFQARQWMKNLPTIYIDNSLIKLHINNKAKMEARTYTTRSLKTISFTKMNQAHTWYILIVILSTKSPRHKHLKD